MEYVYSALLLHSAKQPISEDGVKKVLAGAGIHADEGKVKALVASLEGVNIDDAIKNAAVAMAAPAAGAAQEKKEVPKEDESKKQEEAAAGLSALFG